MRLQFSIRTALVAIALLSPFCFYLANYLKKRHDFVLPTPHEYAAWTKADQARRAEDGNVLAKKKASVHAQTLATRCPPLGRKYWEARAGTIETGMHELALFRQLPSQSIYTSFLVPSRNTQFLVYAVDSEFAAICEVTVDAVGAGPDSLERVVRFHGFAKHHLAFNEWNSLDARELTFDTDGHAHVAFGNDGP